jgi:predicted enzyme related to lactoylglutathione lyase
MSDMNSQHNRAVWFDIPVADLDRAATFYKAVMAVGIDTVDMPGMKFCVIDHDEGNGGCLVPAPELVSKGGILVYLNAAGRIRDAVAKAKANGGKVLEDIVNIGPHGFRAIVLDSEGNRIALHSPTDA